MADLAWPPPRSFDSCPPRLGRACLVRSLLEQERLWKGALRYHRVERVVQCFERSIDVLVVMCGREDVHLAVERRDAPLQEVQVLTHAGDSTSQYYRLIDYLQLLPILVAETSQ